MNFRFLRKNSRLGLKNSRLAPLREFVHKQLIWFAVFCTKTALAWQNRKNSRFHGKNRELELGEQFLQPLGDLLGAALMREAGGEAAPWVHHIDDRAVVHRIV